MQMVAYERRNQCGVTGFLMPAFETYRFLK